MNFSAMNKEMEMLLLSTEVLPSNCEIKEMYSMVQITRAIEISNKSLLRNIFEKNTNEYQEAINQLAASAPSDANAIIGIKATSSTQQFSNGTFLYLTYIGTPITYQVNE
jgi:regulator of nucleoside diphosphate kinase